MRKLGLFFAAVAILAVLDSCGGKTSAPEKKDAPKSTQQPAASEPSRDGS